MPWPATHLITFPRPLHPTPPTLDVLFTTGVPERLFAGRYEVFDTLVSVPGPTGSALMCFAHSFQGNQMCVDVENGEVELLSEGEEPRFVNTNLPLFVATVQAVAERFPYYGLEHTDDEVDSAANDIEGLIREIDPPAVSSPYWDTLIRDVWMGDLTTEDILAYESQRSTQDR